MRRQKPLHELLAEFEQRMDSRLDQIERKLGDIVAAQDDINTDVQAIQTAVADLQTQNGNLGTAVTNIQTEITQLQSQGVDTSGLDRAVQQLQQVQAGIDASVTSVSGVAPAQTPPATS